jgi:hypothetical protein
MNKFFSRNWQHVVAFVVMLLLTLSYFSLQMSGYGLKQHDIAQHRGASHEIQDFRDRTGEEVLWTNSMFGGMPAFQISVIHKGNVFGAAVVSYLKAFSSPGGIVLLYMLGFYILMLCMRVNPWVGLLGAIAFGFSSYEIIILQAGHNSKALAVAFMAPVLGGFIMAYQRNLKWGILLSALFMSIQLAMNHLQITYYLGIVLVFTGIVFLIDALRKKTIKNFVFATIGLIAAYGLALSMNYGNISLTNDYAKYSIRGGNDITVTPEGNSNQVNSTSGLDRDYVTQWSYGIGESFTLLSPYVKGGGTVALGDSPFADDVQNLDLSSAEMNGVMNLPVYWGDQPITTGPVYIGVIVIFLAFLGMIFLKNPIKWALLVAAILTLALSWGKNYMGLTNFFLDNIPGYNKFRAVTIILVIVELCIPLIGVLFLDQLIKEREQIKTEKKKFLIASSVFVLFLFAIKTIGLGDGYFSDGDKKQLEGLRGNIFNQISQMDPAVLQSQYNLDITNSEQLDQFLTAQEEPYQKNYEAMKVVRESIFNSSMNRSLLFSVFAFAVLALFFYTELKSEFVVLGLLVLIAADLIPVARNYLGNQEQGSGYKYWDEKVNSLFPIAASSADQEILQLEIQRNPSLKSKIDEGIKAGKLEAERLGFTGNDSRRVVDAYTFRALNRTTNYRVFDLSGGFSSANSSYFHKALGGYHGAKLRNIQNIFDFHLSKSNNKVYDMFNVRYFIQPGEGGQLVARENPSALGNAWFVKTIETYNSPNDEIRALGSQFSFENVGAGNFVVNGEASKSTTVYGSETVQYVFGNDSLPVNLTNGLREGMEAYFVMDRNGKTNFIPAQMIDMDTTKSFLRLAKLKVTNEFNPISEAVMLSSEAQKLSKKSFSGEGKISMTNYKPNHIVYNAEVSENQLAVFSEVYYPNGWKAYIDNKEVEIRKVNYMLRGLELTRGKHKIEFKFEVPKYKSANTMAWIGSVILLLVFAFGIFTEIKKNKMKLEE